MKYVILASIPASAVSRSISKFTKNISELTPWHRTQDENKVFPAGTMAKGRLALTISV